MPINRIVERLNMGAPGGKLRRGYYIPIEGPFCFKRHEAVPGHREMILLNQAAQELRPLADLVAWFEAQPQERRALVLSEVADMIQHAKPRPEDGALAVKESGLRSTFTACVIISKGADMVRVRKVANLPEAERTKALIILLNLFRISDRRRQRQEVGEPERHWWHQNLGDATVLEEIRRRYREGQL